MDQARVDSKIKVSSKSRDGEGGFLETVKVVIQALLIAVVVRTLLFQPFNIPSGSLIPTLLIGDYLFVSKYSYGYSKHSMPFSPPLFSGRIWGSEPKRGDIAVFKLPKDNSTDYIKRVIGLPGETVQLRAGRIFVNGKELEEPYLEHSLNVAGADEPPTYVKPHYYFVMGDNRDNSSDSRSWGLVPEKYIYGKALFRYWPIGKASVIRHETEYPGIPRRERPDGEEVSSEQ